MVSVGLALGTTEEIPPYDDLAGKRGLRAVSPLSVQMHMPNAPAAAVGLDRKAKAGIMSPVWPTPPVPRRIAAGVASTSCSARPTSRSAAASRPRIEAVPVAAFSQLGMLSTNNDDPPGACRPFDKDRDGMVFGEGGALMLIETEQHAKARGARSWRG